MNRKIITRIIGITFTASALSFFPAMGMNFAKDVFNKTGKAIKTVMADVTHAGAEVTGKISDGLDKAAHKLGKPCDENNKTSEDNVNNIGAGAPNVPATENLLLQAPVINTMECSINYLYSNADSNYWQGAIKRLNTEKLCGGM